MLLKGSKAGDFAQVFSVLGAELDLKEVHRGLFVLGNTQRRLNELVETIETYLEAGAIGKSEAQRLRSRLGFAESLTFGRKGSLALKRLTQHVHAQPLNPAVSAGLELALARLRDRLLSGRGREIKPVALTKRIVFTDASFELRADGSPESGLGGILYDDTGAILSWFGLYLESTMIERLLAPGQKTAILELEAVALIAAWDVWAEQLANRSILFYVDNNSVRDSLIAGSSGNQHMQLALETMFELEDASSSVPWYVRVPSKSNPADDPSRGCFEGLPKFLNPSVLMMS